MAIMATRGNRVTYDLFICVLRNSSSENIIKKIMDQGVITFKEKLSVLLHKTMFPKIINSLWGSGHISLKLLKHYTLK